MKYIESIMWLVSFPAAIVVSYYLVVFFLKKFDKYNSEETQG